MLGKMIACFLISTSLLGQTLPLRNSRLHQVSVPPGTLIVVIECIENIPHRKFVDCMRGPPFLCRPRKPNPSLYPFESTMTVRWTPDPGIVGGLNYVCWAMAPSCLEYDRDWDGDVDLRDFALFTAGDWGDRIKR